VPLFDFTKRMEPVRGIRRRTLKMILEASKSQYPNEFGAMLKAEKGVIRELWLLPGTESGERSALFRLHMMPPEPKIVGTVHSHPSYSCEPSDADLDLFRRFGYCHIIACAPFNARSWACYDGAGDERDLDVVN
jgi:proteasome lid subunit RPN8/RPN11